MQSYFSFSFLQSDGSRNAFENCSTQIVVHYFGSVKLSEWLNLSDPIYSSFQIGMILSSQGDCGDEFWKKKKLSGGPEYVKYSLNANL